LKIGIQSQSDKDKAKHGASSRREKEGPTELIVEDRSRTDQFIHLDDLAMMSEFDESRVELFDQIPIPIAYVNTDIVHGLETGDLVEDRRLALE
jgi:hypothetical protein